MGKHTMRTSQLNFLSKQTRQGKDYLLLGTGFEKFIADLELHYLASMVCLS